MDNKTFSNMKFRPMLKKSLQGIHNDLRLASGEETPFTSVAITPLVLILR